MATAGSLLLLSAGVVGAAGPAAAAHVACGQTILVSTVLDGNIGPCATGVIIGANNVTLDLNGFSITGNPAPGEGPGISLTGRMGVRVTNGTVTQFDAGVAVDGGSRNTVTNMAVLDNRGSGAGEFGDGIALFNSRNNVVTNNKVRNNGPFDGIGLVVSNNNLIDGNQILDNNQSANNTAGIRIENIGFTPSRANTITNNLVTNSGTFGIQVFAGGSDNVIRLNQVLGSRLDGITVFAGGTNNTIEQNLTRANRASGVFVRGAAGAFGAPTNNKVLGNSSAGNAVFDLRDGTPNCGTNVWSANQGVTADPACTRNP